MAVQPQVQPMFVSSTYRISHSIAHEEPMLVSSTFSMTGLRYTYGCATVSAAYVRNLYVQNLWVTLHSWVSNLKCSLCLLALSMESLCYTTLMGVQHYLQPLWLALPSESMVTEHLSLPNLTPGYVC